MTGCVNIKEESFQYLNCIQELNLTYCEQITGNYFNYLVGIKK